MSLPEKLVDYLRNLSSDQLARVAAYFLAPTFVLGLSGFDLSRPGSAIEIERPLALLELKTALSSQGVAQERHGVVAIVEPADIEYWVPLRDKPDDELWTSIDGSLLAPNRARLLVDESGFGGSAPFVGVADPVAIVAAGSLTESLKVPGGAAAIEEWGLSSRRSVSLVTSVFLSCVFGLGAAMALSHPAKAKV